MFKNKFLEREKKLIPIHNLFHNLEKMCQVQTQITLKRFMI